jgi:transcriptional regulator GlxA family with amidase domain
MPTRVDFLVEPDFTSIELVYAADIIRIINRVAAREVFTWRFLSTSGGRVESSLKLSLETENISADPVPPALLVAIGNREAKKLHKGTLSHIAKIARGDTRVILLSETAAAYSMAQRDSDIPLTTHWELRDWVHESSPVGELRDTFYEEHGNIVTAAGMTATADIMLEWAADYVEESVILEVSAILLRRDVRPKTAQQVQYRNIALPGRDPHLKKAIAMMSEDVTKEFSMRELADDIGVSQRALQRKFRSALGTSPSRFLRSLRVQKAARLLDQTDMTLTEIAVASGFNSTRYLSKSFRLVLGYSPSEIRSRSKRTGSG